MSFVLLRVLGTVCIASPLLAAQTPIFRSGVRLIETTVVVHDKAGQPVRDLTAADFRIFEDGKEQKIEMFAVDAAPIESPLPVASATPAAAPTVFTNRLAARTGGGITVILLDRLNSSFEDQKQARDQIIRYLARSRPEDRIAFYVLESDAITVLHEFTSDTRRLVAALNRYLANSSVELLRSEEKAPDFARTGIAALDAETEAWLNRTQVTVSDFYLRRRAEFTTDALESIANHLAGIPGRKNLVWVSAAFPFVIQGAHETKIMNREVSRATRAMNTADVAIYPVDIRGLIGAFVNPATANAPFAAGGKPPQPFTTMATTHPNQDSMRTLAEGSGGRVYLNSNAIGDAVRRAIDDSRVSYVLGYYSPGTAPDNKFHTIDVRVNRGGLDVRHRKGYLALAPPARRTSRERLDGLKRIMLSPLESSAFPLRAHVERESPADGTIVVWVDPAALTWAMKKDVREGAIDVLIAQSTPGGEYFTIKEMTVDLTADPERYQQMIGDGLTLSSKFTLRGDAYRLHVVVADAASQSVGSLIVPLKGG